jgi:3-deoxy-manno-octulosonate cytidylyltransferase (CMP-KDO synthetase)
MPTTPRIVAFIPARMASVRFPGKVLAAKTGKPLVQHVYEAAQRAKLLEKVIVATDDRQVYDAVLSFGGQAVMTRPDHQSGTSRVAEAAIAEGLRPDDIAVNVQGDEPEMDPVLIDAAVAALRSGAGGCPMATSAIPFAPGEDAANPNLVKVVLRKDGRALYFSRALIPYVRDTSATDLPMPLKHVGLYAYRRSFLDQFSTFAPTPLERSEVLEQLRVMEHGHDIAVAVRESENFGGIDTPEQYEAFVARWRARQPRLS